MKEVGVKPSFLTMKILFKCFGESGSIGRIMEVYERMFLDGTRCWSFGFDVLHKIRHFLS
jgi:hypothetical protein